MTTRVIRIQLDTGTLNQQLNQTNRRLKRVEKNSEVLSRGFKRAATAAGGFVAALGVREIIQAADAMVTYENRLRLVTDSQAELNTVQEALIGLSRDTRGSFGSTIELYSRLARATQDLNLSGQETIDITKSINQAVRISGATATEAEAAIIQFSQGLGSGALRGEELNSVLEQAPRLAKALADGLGVGIGELRELGQAGELSAERVTKALQSQAHVLESEFGQVAPTLSEGFTALKDSLTIFTGDLVNATGVTESFATILGDLSGFLIDNADDAALFATAVREGITAVIADLAAELETVDERFSLFQNTVVGVIATIAGNTEVRDAAIAARLGLERELSAAEAEANARLLQIQAQIREQADRARREITDRDPAALNEGGGGRNEQDVGPSADQIKDAEKFLQGLRNDLEQATLATTLFDDELEAAVLRMESARAIADNGITGSLAEEIKATTEALIEQQRAAERAEQLRENQAEDSDYIASLEQEVAMLGLSNEQREIEIALRQLSADATDEQRRKVEELVEAISAEAERLEELEAAEQAAEEVAGQITDILFKGFEDGFDGARNAMADLLQDLAQQIIQSQIQDALTGIFTGAAGGGGAGGFIAGLFAPRASGGETTPGVPYLVGEEGPELIVSRHAGQVIPAGQTRGLLSSASGSAGGGSGIAALIEAIRGIEPTLINVNEQDPAALLSTMNTHEGARVQRNFVNADERYIKRTLGVR